MNRTLVELFQSIACTFAFAPFLLPPGFLAGRALNIFAMRRRSAAEQLAWSTVLSLPLSIVLSELVGRILPPAGVLFTFSLIAITALTRLRSRSPKAAILPPCERQATNRIFVILTLLAAIAVFGTLNVTVGDQLFVPATIQDWAVRLPMLRAAILSPHVPPYNILSAIDGPPAPLRYYYFWYVLCAQVARLTHLPPLAVLTGSAVWAVFGLIGAGFLALKYLLGLRTNLRTRCLLFLLPFSAIGLDGMQGFITQVRKDSNPLSDFELWRPDRSPGFLTTMLKAPHHLVGVVCCFAALLLMVELRLAASNSSTSDSLGAEPTARIPPIGLLLRALLVAVAFAACIGDSTFIFFIFTFVCFFWGVDLLLKRHWKPLLLLAVSTVASWILSRPYLLELRSNSSAAKGFVTLGWRSNLFVATAFHAKHILVHHPFAALVARQPVILLMDFIELGFFIFVAAYTIRRELWPALRGRRTLTAGEISLWCVFFAASLCTLFVSSSITQSVNDLGMHAQILLRFVLTLWSVPYLVHLWRERYSWKASRPLHKLVTASAVACLALGVLGQFTNLLANRLYFPVMENHLLRGPMSGLTDDRLAARVDAIRTASITLDRILPADARVQYNPSGLLQPAFSFFSNRQVIASDDGCGTSFGGDYEGCKPVKLQFHHLFASTILLIDGKDVGIYPPSGQLATLGDFDQACTEFHIDAILVDSTDPVWFQPGSWVWRAAPLIAGPTLRVLACPRPDTALHTGPDSGATPP